MMDARSLITMLGGRWCGFYGLARCPSHDDREPSLKIKDDNRKSDGIDLHCFAGCSWQDVKTEFRRQGLLSDYRTTTRAVGRAGNIGIMVETDRRQAEQNSERRRYAALRLWSETIPLNGTLGQRYFVERRGLHIGAAGFDHCLRWHDGTGAIIALMTDPASNEPTGVHRTYVNLNATKRERKMLGRQGVVRLSCDEDVTQGLGITEGIEDGLAVLLSGWAPVWAATSAGAIAKFPVLLGIGALTIFRDDNKAGSEAAETCAKRWHGAGRQVLLASLRDRSQ